MWMFFVLKIHSKGAMGRSPSSFPDIITMLVKIIFRHCLFVYIYMLLKLSYNYHTFLKGEHL